MDAVLPVSDLYRQHRSRALAIARRILNDRDEAEDVVQEVFSRLCLKPLSFEGRARCTTWLHRIMVNSAINRLRSRRRQANLFTETAAPLSPEEGAIASESRARFEHALSQVSEQHRQVLWLREVRGYSYPEIAALLRIPEGTVKSAINRGRNRVLELIEREG
jgi:RNA polymerase sigma-70 factor (ECF subfamily)